MNSLSKSACLQTPTEQNWFMWLRHNIRRKCSTVGFFFSAIACILILHFFSFSDFVIPKHWLGFGFLETKWDRGSIDFVRDTLGSSFQMLCFSNWCTKCYSCYNFDCFYNESVIISSHLCGFIRFLNHMAKFDWENQPLVVNINDDIKGQFYWWLIHECDKRFTGTSFFFFKVMYSRVSNCK